MEAAHSELTGEILTGLPEAPVAGRVGTQRVGFPDAVERPAVRTRSLPKVARATVQRWSLALADMGSAALALVVAVTVLGDDRLAILSFAGLPLIVVVSKAFGLYDRDELVLRKSTLEDAPKLFQLGTLYALVIWLLEDILITGQLGQRQVLGLWVILIVFTPLARAGARALCRAFGAPERCLIMGEGELVEQLEAKLDADASLSATVVAAVGLEEQEGQIPWSALSLQTLVEQERVDRVLVAPQHADSREVLELIRTLSSLGVQVSIFPRLFEVAGSSVEFDDLNGLPLLGINSFRVSRSTRFLKRAFDLLGAVAGLLVLSPLLALIGLAVKLDSPGPVLFRQRRIGRDGQEFEIVKFRTMVDGADRRKAELLDRNEAQGLFKIRDDPRITSVGRPLRRFSLDELPQLWNVVCGQMSLVGPRPLVDEEDRKVTGWDRRRLELTPGMTGPWQVLGSARVPLSEMVKIDYAYTANWSLWSDLKLVLRTLPFVAQGRGQ